MTTAPNAKCQRVLCTRCMSGLDSGYNSSNFDVCIFDCAVDSYFAFSVDPVLFYTRHSASPRRSHYYAYMQAARYSVWQTEHFDFGNHHASHDATSRRSSSLVLMHEKLSHQTVRDKIVCAWPDCLSVTKTSDVDANDATRFSICLEVCHDACQQRCIELRYKYVSMQACFQLRMTTQTATERKEFSVERFLQEETKKTTKSKNNTEIQLARMKNKVRRHEQNLRKQKQRLRDMLTKMREEEAMYNSACLDVKHLQEQLADDDNKMDTR